MYPQIPKFEMVAGDMKKTGLACSEKSREEARDKDILL
jgi:hypothetical protein